MRRKLALFLCAFYLFSANAFGKTMAKFSPAMNMVASQRTDEISLLAEQFSIFSHPVTGETTVGVLIKLKNASDVDTLKRTGCEVHTILSSGIVTGCLSLRKLDAVRILEEVEYVEPAAKRYPAMDVSRPEIGIDKVHRGQNLPAAYQGDGVIVGIIDSGIDYKHPDFKNPDGTTRIVYIWDQCAEDGIPPEGYNYGNECDPGEINSGNCAEKDDDVNSYGHGTHVAGIAAGNGRAPNDNADYTGIAPKADIIIVNSGCKGYLPDDWVIDATNYIFSKAQGTGKPAVINMSFGGQFGPHDGTSLYERALTEFTGPGRIIVNSAGNEGSDFIHLGYQVDYNGAESLFMPYQGAHIAVFDMWYSSDYQIDVRVGRVSKITGAVVEYTSWVPPGQLFREIYMTGQLIDIDATETGNPQNGDRHVLMTIVGTRIDRYRWAVGFRAHQENQIAAFDCWSAGETGSFAPDAAGFVPGDNLKSVGMPGTAYNLIAVGAYNTKNQWIDMNGKSQSYPEFVLGDRAVFSSIGPSRDGRLKPEIAAPGLFIVSCLTSDVPIGPDGIAANDIVLGGYYQKLQGTSMSCPHITGTVALMLQQNAKLDYNQIVEIFAETARSDQYTGQLPNTSWGYGKINGYKAVATVIDSGITTIREEVESQIFTMAFINKMLNSY